MTDTNALAVDPKKPKAPAVTTAIAVLSYLAKNPSGAGLTEIARSLGLGKSICFNVLNTMLAESIVIKEERRAIWKLGPRLVQLGYAARTSYPIRSEFRANIPLAVKSVIADPRGLLCVVGQLLLDRKGIVIIDRLFIGERRLGQVQIPIGEVFSMTAPVLGRAFLALNGDDEAIAIATDPNEPRSSDWQPALLKSLAMIRANGYATAIGEYATDVNAAGCAIPARLGQTQYAVCVLGRKEDLPVARLPTLGKALIAATREIQSWD
ncbi:helix-turn-helix domain-containing protein [Roseomonas terrae]|uniref:Helix-turn-helix domain-containing protein n=1 Tax=Neoroseomonas terrae TaxID=424799 RepID=A0ABS5EQ69_9PROT|nr:IclR family transcriptional regulator C-terminal domain-containing protein [Neoroseomonas terrae]MBR0653179.1 helix-turn-helix domain-containing protein [Neoroseomonas terrae]